MNFSEKILAENARIGDHIVQKMREDLQKGDLSLVIETIEPLLEKIYADDIERRRLILSRLNFLNKAKYKLSNLIIELKAIAMDMIRHSETGEIDFFDPNDFAWVRDVERRYPELRAEVDVALESPEMIPGFEEIQEVQSKLSNDRKWKVIVFRGFGEAFNENAELFPATMSALGKIPGWTTAMYSILEPNKTLPPHYGHYNGVLRYHLGIRVPEKCGIKVKDETRYWQDGSSLIFDDSFQHSAWNLSAEPRVVLFVDFLRPLLFPLNIMNEWIVELIGKSDFVQDMNKNLHKYQPLLDTLKGKKARRKARARDEKTSANG
jgi:ornithine lipid ester-linked acyl 2-hydroxylase